MQTNKQQVVIKIVCSKDYCYPVLHTLCNKASQSDLTREKGKMIQPPLSLCVIGCNLDSRIWKVMWHMMEQVDE